MSSLCLLSVDDVYEQYWLAAECLMVHKIKPRLSAVLRLPSGSHVVKACWEYKFQTDNQVNTANSSFFSFSPLFPSAPFFHSLSLPSSLSFMEFWYTSPSRKVLLGNFNPDTSTNLSRAPCAQLGPHSPLFPSFLVLFLKPSLPASLSPFSPSLYSPSWLLRYCIAAPAVYDKNIILLLLNNPINLSTGRKLTSCLFG